MSEEQRRYAREGLERLGFVLEERGLGRWCKREHDGIFVWDGVHDVVHFVQAPRAGGIDMLIRFAKPEGEST